MKNFAITTIASAAIMLATAMTMQAQEQETKFSIKPTGRMLLDGAVYMPDGDGFSDGVAMPDIAWGQKSATGNGLQKSTWATASAKSA